MAPAGELDHESKKVQVAETNLADRQYLMLLSVKNDKYYYVKALRLRHCNADELRDRSPFRKPSPEAV